MIPVHGAYPSAQRGFTLMEALVALVLVGTALAVVVSGLGRPAAFLRKADLHATARELAQQKLDEFALSSTNQVAEGPEELNLHGVSYGYRLRYEPAAPIEALPLAGTPLEGKLLNVTVEVFWGQPPQSLSLQTLVLRP